jgi:hypothetical protein
VLYSTVQYCAVLYRAALYCAVLRCAVLCRAVLCCAVLCCTCCAGLRQALRDYSYVHNRSNILSVQHSHSMLAIHKLVIHQQYISNTTPA